MKATNKLIILFFCIGALYSHAQKKSLLPKEYDRWYDLQQVTVNDHGTAVSYRKSNVADTLFVELVGTMVPHKFHGVTRHSFSTVGKRILLNRQNESLLVDLERNDTVVLPKMEQTLWSPKGLLIWSANGQFGTYNVKRDKYSIHHTGFEKVFFSTDGKWGMGTIKNRADSYEIRHFYTQSLNESTLIDISAIPEIQINFSPDGSSCTYKIVKDGGTEEYKWLRRGNDNFQKQMFYSSATNSGIIGNEIYIDDRNERIFANFRNPQTLSVNEKVRVYDGDIQSLQPLKTVAEWRWDSSAFKTVEDSLNQPLLPTYLKDSYVLLDSQNYDPRDTGGINYADLYAVNGHTRSLIAAEIPVLENQIIIMPHKPYVLYFKQGHWWSYSLIDQLSVCLTSGIPAGFEDMERDQLSAQQHYGVAGYFHENEKIWLYSKNDIWELSLNGKGSKCITADKDKKYQYRLLTDEGRKPGYMKMSDISKLHTYEKYLVKAYDDVNQKEGLLVWSQGLMQLVVLLPQRIVFALFTADNRKVFMKYESAAHAPLFILTDVKGRSLWNRQTNLQQQNYHWTTRKMVHVSGTDIRGGLLYPADWDPAKKYPVIVYMYEKMSKRINRYVLPEYGNNIGFNHTLMTLNNYFVLYPDFEYQHNNVMDKPLNHLMQLIAAVGHVEPSADIQKAGLIGHSFGGYETMFLITQTNFFKAAVAGAGVSDLEDMYYAESGKGGFGMLLSEGVQFRMDNPVLNPGFQQFNPLAFAHNVQTPLLLWAGRNDRRVAWMHSYKMYQALWRQKKKVCFLSYDKEDHVLMDKINQEHLTRSILHFFDSKLKE